MKKFITNKREELKELSKIPHPAEFDKYYAQQEKEIPTNTLADLLGDSLTDKLK